MTPAEQARPRVGVRITPRLECAGEYLADVRALDAAGADSLWPDGDEDPWLVLAATAAVTGRMRLVLPVSAGDVAGAAGSDGPWWRRLAALQRLSRTRIVVRAAPAVAAQLLRAAACPVFVELPDAVDGRGWLPADGRMPAGIVQPEQREPPAAAAAADRRTAAPPGKQAAEPRAAETWLRVGTVVDRASWRSTLAACREAGCTGVVVPFAARLVDLLRNPDPDEDRSDLQLAQG